MRRAFAILTSLWLIAGCRGSAGGSTGSATRPGDVETKETGVGATPAANSSSHDNAQCEAQLLTAWSATPPMTSIGPESVARSYRNVIGALMRDFKVKGGAVAVTKDGRLVFAMGLGMSDVDNFQPVIGDQLFRIASLTKNLTSTAVMRLVAAGKINLDAPALSYLEDVRPLPGKSVNPQLRVITVRHLLNHTGGWNREFEAVHDPMFLSNEIASALGKPGPATCDDTIRFMLDKPITYVPGTTNCYSNFGYCLLGRIIERASGATYYEYVKSSLLTPTGATRMRLGKSLLGGRADDEVRYYPYEGEKSASSVFPAVSGQVPWEYGRWSLEAMDAHGGFLASPVDMLRTQLAVDGLPKPDDLVDANALAQIMENPNVATCTADGKSKPTDPSSWYGFGWSVNKHGNHWHMGSLDGTITEAVTASNGFSWAAFFNGRPQDAGGFTGRLDRDLWTALGGANGWTGDDYFDQFPAAGFSEWQPAATFMNEWDSRKAGHQYPIRVEGRVDAGATQYRAEWAPVRGKKAPESQVAMDCVTYREKHDGFLKMGYAEASVQSFVGANGRRSFQATWASW